MISRPTRAESGVSSVMPVGAASSAAADRAPIAKSSRVASGADAEEEPAAHRAVPLAAADERR